MICKEFCDTMTKLLKEKGNGYLILDNGSYDFVIVKGSDVIKTTSTIKLRVENIEEKTIPVHLGELICTLNSYGDLELKLYSKMSEFDLYEDDLSDMEFRVGGTKECQI